MKLSFEQSTLEINPSKNGFNVTLNEQTVFVEVLRRLADRLELIIHYTETNFIKTTAFVSAEGNTFWVTINGQTFRLIKQSARSRRAGSGIQTSGVLTAPMPGAVRGVLAAEGDSVSKGQTLLIMEAMKMEIKIAAPADGLINKLLVQEGQTVEKDQPLIELN